MQNYRRITSRLRTKRWQIRDPYFGNSSHWKIRQRNRFLYWQIAMHWIVACNGSTWLSEKGSSSRNTHLCCYINSPCYISIINKIDNRVLSCSLSLDEFRQVLWSTVFKPVKETLKSARSCNSTFRVVYMTWTWWKKNIPGWTWHLMLWWLLWFWFHWSSVFWQTVPLGSWYGSPSTWPL